MLSGVALGEMPGSGLARAHVDALRVRGLRKAFSAVAVDNLDLTVRAGELYALLGPNGAGKTTTLRMVAGLLPPDAGSIEIFGIDALADPVAAKRDHGVAARRADALRQALAARVPRVRRRPVGRRAAAAPSATPRSCWRSSSLRRTATRAARASRAA